MFPTENNIILCDQSIHYICSQSHDVFDCKFRNVKNGWRTVRCIPSCSIALYWSHESEVPWCASCENLGFGIPEVCFIFGERTVLALYALLKYISWNNIYFYQFFCRNLLVLKILTNSRIFLTSQSVFHCCWKTTKNAGNKLLGINSKIV